MTIVIGVLFAALQLALWAALRRRIDALPLRIAALVRRERIDAGEQAATTLQEATAARVGPLVNALRIYHDQMRQDLVGQLAGAERRTDAAGTALATGFALVRELRTACDELLACSRTYEPSAARATRPDSPVAKDDADDEPTTIASRHAIPPPPVSQARALPQETQ